MILVNIMGGLGNQLFEYATGRAVAERLQAELFLDLSLMNNSTSTNTSRCFDLGAFDIKANIASSEQIKKFFYYRHNITPFRYIVNNLNRWKNGMHRLKETSAYAYEPVIENVKDNTYLSGNFQSYQYFKSIRNILLKELVLKEPLSAECEQLHNRMAAENSVAVHFRRGDYIANADYYHVCDLGYYKEALDCILDKVENPVFYVFSEDIEWARQTGLFDLLTVYYMNPNSSYIDLTLMKSCKHQVIANSTFSWWGAWLNTNDNKIVIAPVRWFKDNSDFEKQQSLLPDEWIKI